MISFFSTTFSSFKIRNFRLYYSGQIISVSGTFLQALAQDWLVLKLTNSGIMLGLVSALQFLPMLIISPWGGTISDRFSKLKLLYITQIISCVLAFALGTLILTGAIQIWMIFIFALCLGLVNSVDSPTRQGFVYEMVGKDQIKNAVSLWGILISATRVIGPALAGILIATVGLGLCFIINSISYIAVFIVFLMMNKKELNPSTPVPYAKGQIKEGFKYVLSTPALLTPLVMMAIIGTITFEWQASMPLFAKFILHGDAGMYSVITVALSLGMIIGGLVNARTRGSSLGRLNYLALFFGIFVLISSVLTNVIFVVIAFFLVGIFSMSFANTTTSMLQVSTDPSMRGRVMSFWAMAFFGSTAIGGPIVGWIGEVYGARWALAVGGIAAIIAAVYGFIVLWRGRLKVPK